MNLCTLRLKINKVTSMIPRMLLVIKNQLREISAAIGHKRALSSSNHNSPLVKERRSLIWHVLTRQCTAKVGFTFKKNLFPFPTYLRLIFLLSWMLGKNHDRELEWESPGNIFISHFIFQLWFIKDFES